MTPYSKQQMPKKGKKGGKGGGEDGLVAGPDGEETQDVVSEGSEDEDISGLMKVSCRFVFCLINDA